MRDNTDGREERLERRLAAERRRCTRVVAENTELRRLLDTDPKTGALTETAFRRHLQQRIADLRDGCVPGFAVAHGDLDKFKEINDEFANHAAGNALLRCVAESARACLSDADLIARFHGDEFAFLLDAQTSAELSELISRLHGPYWTRYRRVVIERSMSIDGLLVCNPEDLVGLDDRLEHLLYADKAARRQRKCNF